MNLVNKEVVDNITAITETNKSLSKIGTTLGRGHSKVQIEPLTRKISDLHKGMDITFREGEGASFSVSQHGMGTRSWISFLTLGSYVDYIHKQVKEDEEDDLVILSLEEPEAHLHPQAQRQIYRQLIDFNGQKLVSTHSTSILAQTDLENLLHFKKVNGKTEVRKFAVERYSDDELAKIKREVVNTHGELIYSSAVVLCEGITEEQALPIYFNEFFGVEPVFLGINIIAIRGQNYKTYLKLFKEYDISWYIFSDGEEKTIKTVKKALKEISEEKSLEDYDNVFIIKNGWDYEKMLIKNGNSEEIINAINVYNDDDEYYNKHKNMVGQLKTKRVKTDKPPCVTCGQDIYEDVVEDSVVGLDEEETSLYKCMTTSDGKAKYALPVAESITKSEDIYQRFPSEILHLLTKLELDFGLSRKEEYNGIESVGETTTNS